MDSLCRGKKEDVKDSYRWTTPSEKMQINVKSMNTEVFKVYVEKPVFLGGTSALNWLLRIFLGSLKETVVWDMSIL